MTWPEMHRIISEAVAGEAEACGRHPRRGTRRPWPARCRRVGCPFNLAQVQMSREDNAGDTTEFRADFDVEPAPFEATVKSYADQL